MLVILFLIGLIFINFKSCDSGISAVEKKSVVSLLNDSLQRIHTAATIDRYDSLIKVKRVSDSLHGVNVALLTNRYNALRTIVKNLKPVVVDSIDQVVNSVPASAYNASIEQGYLCDSLIVSMDYRLSDKDSIANYFQSQYLAEKKLNVTSEQALSDLKSLSAEEKKGKEKAQKLNRKIPSIVGLSVAITAVLVALVLK